MLYVRRKPDGTSNVKTQLKLRAKMKSVHTTLRLTYYTVVKIEYIDRLVVVLNLTNLRDLVFLYGSFLPPPNK